MKKASLILIIIITLIFCLNSVFAIEVISPNYAVYNGNNLKLIMEKNNEEKIAIASITKVMTSIVAIENIKDLNESITIDMDIVYGKIDPELAIIGIESGQNLTYYDLLCGTLISSSADCAVYLSNIVFESQDVFISKMNEKAQEIGMTNTNFSNVTGLDDENNYSTLDDVAKMMQYAMKNNTLKEIMSSKEYTMTDGRLTCTSTIDRLVKLENIENSYIIGGKTGTTGDAGLCLASFSEDEGVPLICVVTGVTMYSTIPYNVIDTQKIYDEVINTYSLNSVVKEGDTLVTLDSYCTKENSVEIKAKNDVKYYSDNINSELIEIKYEGLPNVDYTVKNGEQIGKISIYYDNELLDTYDVNLEQDLNFSLIEWVKLNKEAIVTFGGIALFMVIIITVLSRKK